MQKKIIKSILLLVNFVILLPVFMTSTMAQTLLFKSGFEEGVYLDDPESDYQYIRGTDKTSGYSWPIESGGYKGHLHHIPVSAVENGDSYAKIVEVMGHDNTMTKSLFKSFSNDGDYDYPQCGYKIAPSKALGDEIYMNWWEKITDDFANSGDWRTVWFSKTPGEPAGERVEAYIYTDNGKKYWHIHQDGGVWGGYQHFNFVIDNHDVPVPIGEWFQHEVYWKRSTGNDGRVFWAINYQDQHYVIADYNGISQKDSQDINQIVWGHIYGIPKGETYAHWLDDVEIWSTIPQTKIELLPVTNLISPQLTVHPNPTHGISVVKINSDSKSTCIANKLGIYSVSGRLIDELKPKNRSFVWNINSAVPNGIYLMKLEGKQSYQRTKIFLIR